ncbi:ribosomal-protein-alanine N-acetyltransferase [Cerasibacillus quisquiliarum]|uniref:N-acetyltransferase GCN5 n=1 Tax=Cerasibacillus quisquiliarum TaxID=227865 RepID=A0A511UZN9_9BACI|nr:GNAT family N-acetyltransferase [Cerasibacillus quisquiliarum]MBB5147314.1 ribosomal-protein-alanine N-acetyltransferase [Cerasibacillus quisquiliarum]GEN32117.1 N-acetyltransferase GCN5 [Cerasibacillus quisquiliarum]
MLETDRCVLLKLQENDYEAIKQLYMNTDIRRYLGGILEEDTIKKTFLNMVHQKMDGLNLVVKEKSTHTFVGLISLDTHHDGISTEVSYQILPKWWGKGIGSEVVEEVINYAFKSLNLPEVIAETQTANKPSCRLLEKLGMNLRETLLRFGEEQAVYCLTNPYH